MISFGVRIHLRRRCKGGMIRYKTREGGKREMERDISYAFGSLLSFSFFFCMAWKRREMKSRFRAICVLLSGIELNWEREGGCGMVVCVVAQRSWLNLARFLTGVFFSIWSCEWAMCSVRSGHETKRRGSVGWVGGKENEWVGSVQVSWERGGGSFPSLGILANFFFSLSLFFGPREAK